MADETFLYDLVSAAVEAEDMLGREEATRVVQAVIVELVRKGYAVVPVGGWR